MKRFDFNGKHTFRAILTWFIVLEFSSNCFNGKVDAAVRSNDSKDLYLSKKERDALQLFKQRVERRLPEPFMKTDFYLVRWLRARNFNIPAAQEMLEDNLKWREKSKISNILNEDFSDLEEDFPVTVEGHDKQFRPIVTMDIGTWDVRSAVLQGRLPRLLRFMDWIQEEALHRILNAQYGGKNVTRAMVLVNLEGLNLLQHLCASCMSVWLRATIGMESHFPGFWEAIILINAPAVTRIGLEAVTPVMSTQTRETLKVFGTNRSEWLQYLDERIDPDQRTFEYGGTMKSTH